jgi:hypothetical protein
MKISGYTTTRNSVEMNYPFVECIKSMLDFCDEVVVADSTDHETDSTLEILGELAEKNDKIKVVHVPVDYSVPNFGIWDGKMKAVARSQCTGDYLWQMDGDEVVPTGSRQLIEDVINKTLANNPQALLVALPVVEYWGSSGKVRVDVNPWKWRLSKNDPNITHGIPKHLRKWEYIDGYDEPFLFAKHGTDTCDYIWKNSGGIVPCVHFMTSEVEQVRQHCLSGDKNSLLLYESWFNKTVAEFPTVYHFSWWSVAEKIKKFKHTFNDLWLSMYNEKKEEDPDWNPFFDQSLKTVNNSQILLYSKVIEEYTGGHIFHKKWNFTTMPSIKINQPIPEVIKPWIVGLSQKNIYHA